MNKDPFSELIELMRREGAKYNPPSLLIGEVISPNPLIVAFNGIQIDKDNILISDYLLDNYEREIDIPETDGTGVMSEVGLHTHEISRLGLTGKLKFTDTLKKGDSLAIMPTIDLQTFIIISKVVKPE